jgi:hypothetical protein
VVVRFCHSAAKRMRTKQLVAAAEMQLLVAVSFLPEGLFAGHSVARVGLQMLLWRHGRRGMVESCFLAKGATNIPISVWQWWEAGQLVVRVLTVLVQCAAPLWCRSLFRTGSSSSSVWLSAGGSSSANRPGHSSGSSSTVVLLFVGSPAPLLFTSTSSVSAHHNRIRAGILHVTRP